MSESSNVVGMPGIANAIPPGEVCHETVALIRDWLNDAERGELVGVCIAGVKRGGGSRTNWAGIASCDQMLAAASGLQHRIASSWSNLLDFE